MITEFLFLNGVLSFWNQPLQIYLPRGSDIALFFTKIWISNMSSEQLFLLYSIEDICDMSGSFSQEKYVNCRTLKKKFPFALYVYSLMSKRNNCDIREIWSVSFLTGTVFSDRRLMEILKNKKHNNFVFSQEIQEKLTCDYFCNSTAHGQY